MKRNQLYLLAVLSLSLFEVSAESGGKPLDMNYLLGLSLEELMQIDITVASRTRQAINQAPAAVTLITADDIAATGATNLVDVLATVPGIHIRVNQFAARPLIQIRGASGGQTMLMVNGAPVRDLMWAHGIFWKGFPVSMIDRVEVIRGPGSALYGADASAGVINVITKTAGHIENAEVGMRSGSFDSHSAWAQYGGEWRGYQTGFTADVFTTDGYAPFIAADAQTGRDQLAGTQVSYAPADAAFGWQNLDLRYYLANDNWRLQADYVRHSDLEIGITGAAVLDPVTQGEDSKYNVDLLYSNANFSNHWGLDAALRYQHLDYNSGEGFLERPPGFTDSSGVYPDGQINQMESAERRLNVEVSGLYHGIRDHAVYLGAGSMAQDLYRVEQRVNFGTGPDGNALPAGSELVDLSDTPYAFAPEKIRRLLYVIAQDDWTITPDWQLTSGVRYDDFSDFGSVVNPRLALVWKTTDKFTSKLMYGQAYRAPSYQELFAETSNALPNPDLDAERSHTVEAALNYLASPSLYLALNIYYFQVEDFIRTMDVGLSTMQFQNVGVHRVRGVETEARWQASDNLRLYANYTLRNPDDGDYRVVDQPEQDAYVRADWQWQAGWNWNLQANWIADRIRAATDARQPVDDYLLVDSTLRKTMADNWEFAVSVRNLFDTDAREPTGASLADDLPLPERNVYVEVKYGLQ